MSFFKNSYVIFIHYLYFKWYKKAGKNNFKECFLFTIQMYFPLIIFSLFFLFFFIYLIKIYALANIQFIQINIIYKKSERNTNSHFFTTYLLIWNFLIWGAILKCVFSEYLYDSIWMSESILLGATRKYNAVQMT